MSTFSMTWHAFLRFSRTKDRGAGLNVLVIVESRGFGSCARRLVGWLQERERREGRGCRYLILSGGWDLVDREEKNPDMIFMFVRIFGSEQLSRRAR